MKSTGLLIPTMQPCYFRSMMIAALLAIALGTMAQSSVKPQPVPLPGSELRRFHSKIMDQDFLIYVQLPLDYVSDGSKQYPVMYMTDGNRFFPLVANMSTLLGFPPTGFPQIIVVGVAYDIKDMFQWAAWRTRDLTPTVNTGDEQYWEGLLRRMTGDTTLRVETGGGPRFLSFICDELVPFIESEYQVSDQGRALAGYSYGGLFTLFAMFERPEVFQRYFAGSPSITYGNRELFEMEKTYNQNHTDLHARLYLSIGGLEDQNWIAGLNEMANILESRNYPNLDVRTQVFEGEWHGSAGPASIMRAFINLYGE